MFYFVLFLFFFPVGCSPFRFQTPTQLIPNAALAGINDMLAFDNKRKEDCEELKRTLEVESSTFRRKTKEEKVEECRAAINPEAEKVF